MARPCAAQRVQFTSSLVSVNCQRTTPKEWVPEHPAHRGPKSGSAPHPKMELPSATPTKRHGLGYMPARHDAPTRTEDLARGTSGLEITASEPESSLSHGHRKADDANMGHLPGARSWVRAGQSGSEAQPQEHLLPPLQQEVQALRAERDSLLKSMQSNRRAFTEQVLPVRCVHSDTLRQ